ncbi:MAG: hypothetical protein ACKO23_12675 [Gemmataceae bacterium]
MSDRARNLVIAALTRSATEGQPLPLHESRSSPGLFPSGAAAKQAAKRCLDEGLLISAKADSAAESPAHSARGDGSFAISEKGYQYLLEQTSPREILEDCLRVVESRKGELEAILATSRKMLRSLESIQEIAGRAVDGIEGGPNTLNRLCQKYRSRGPETTGVDLADWLSQAVSCWSPQAGSGDCPLPELYRAAGQVYPELTPGLFHDALRKLHHQRRIYLHPWTGPLYRLPEPNLALMVGHEVAYYASHRPQEAG